MDSLAIHEASPAILRLQCGNDEIPRENVPRRDSGADSENDDDEEDEVPKKVGFDNKSVRAAFVRKVFTLVTVMFTVTGICASIPFMVDAVHEWCVEYWWVSYIAIGTFAVFYIMLACCSCVRRCFPCNFITLVLFTLSAGAMTMFICAQYKVQSVLIALLITTLCSAAITVFAATTKKDLTSCLGIAFILGICLLLFGLMCMIFVVFMKWYFLNIVYSGLAALLCMFYLAIDIQLIMGGRKVEISSEEYIYAAVTLFVDILSMFFNILGVVGN